MSTQIRNSGGSRNQKKSNSGSGGGGGDSISQASHKKTDTSKTEKEKSHPKPTAEQLRIAQITNSNTSEDPQMREKVATLIEMTQRSEEEVCCALYECDNNMDNAVLFLLETLPVGAFETSSKKKKNKAANAAQDNNGGGGDGDWADGNANTDKREKSRNRNSSNRGGRAGSDSRGWRGREARENERNSRGGGGDRDDRTNDNYRGGPRGVGGGDNRRGVGGGRGGGYVGRGGRGGGRMGGGRGAGGRGDRSGGGYSSRYNNTNDDHQEVELWDNTIAQNAEKQQQQSQDDAWGDWDNEEYVGSLKDSKVFTTSNLPNQTAASVLSSGLAGSGASVGGTTNTTGMTSDLSSQQGLDHHHLGTSVIGSSSMQTQSQGSHLNSLVGSNAVNTGLDDNATSNLSSVTATPIMQYSAAVSSTPQMQQPQQQSSVGGGNSLTGGTSSISGSNLSSSQYGSAVDSFSNAATAAANLVQQAQQQHLEQQMKSSTTLSVEQSQYFNSLTSQNSAGQSVVGNVQQQQPMASYAQNPNSVQYPTSYANVFGTGTSSTGSSTAISSDPTSQMQSGQQPQVRRARAKLPPPSKIPSSAVEMPSDSLNNIGYIDVQFGGLDFNTDESFENLSEKFNTSVTLDSQQTQQQAQQKSLVQSPQDVSGSAYDQTKAVTQQQSLTAGLPNSHLVADTLTAAGYTQRTASQQQQQQTQQISGVSGSAGQGVGGSAGSNALDQLTKNDPYQQNSTAATAYQSSYQSAANVSNKGVANAYQPSVASQGYSNSAYGNVQSSVANSYQPQAYGSYQQNSMASYQQQQQQSAAQAGQGASNVTGGSAGVGGVANSTQNIPSVGGNSSSNSATANSNSSYLSSAYGSQQNAYQSSQSVYGSTGLSNSTGYTGSTNTSSSQYSNFSTSAKLKDPTSTSSNTSHYESVSSSNAISNSSGTSVNSVSSAVNSNNAVTNTNNNANSSSSNSSVANNAASNVVSQSASGGSGVGGVGNVGGGVSNSSSNSNVNSGSATSAGVSGSGSVSSAVAASSGGVSSAANKTGSVTGSSGAPTGGSGGGAGSGMVPNIQMVSQYIQTSLPYYQQPVYSYEDLQMMQQRVPHVQGYYDLNYTTPTSLGAGRDNLGSVAYSTMTDGRFTRTDNNSSPVSNVSSTMSQQAGSSGPMLNVPYAYFYGGNVMPGSFQYGTPAIYPQIPAANTASGGQFPKPSYNTGYGSTNYDALSQASQDYTNKTYPSSVNQPTKSQNVTNPPQAGTASDITSSMYGKGHVALNKVNSYEKQNFHSGTPPPFNMANTQTAGGTSTQPYGMYLSTMPATAGHHMIHPQIHQDSNSTGQRQPTSSQSKSATKQGYSPSYWTGQN
ncbi:protein lingerer isoform X3 [Stomoxys calcitrans]|uniref:protein lingerer isoform X3 n=1 Tax=Stomoxys calcitrans TaxID=35570 RepID=UPI0027E395C5|nr:protein lingerer isoform X3 [Stomoxys calcitrans]